MGPGHNKIAPSMPIFEGRLENLCLHLTVHILRIDFLCYTVPYLDTQMLLCVSPKMHCFYHLLNWLYSSHSDRNLYDTESFKNCLYIQCDTWIFSWLAVPEPKLLWDCRCLKRHPHSKLLQQIFIAARMNTWTSFSLLCLH
jgi:hypothetical protein